MTISIIIATFNSAKTIQRCLNSIVPQLDDSSELIIIDGGSKDETMDIVLSYGNKIAYFLSEPDHGVYDAWNKGIRHAKGEWITFIGSDDELLPQAINYYKEFLSQSENDYDIVCGKLYFVNKDGKIIREVGEPWDWNKMAHRTLSFAHPGMLHNKRCFERIGSFDTRYKICADSDFLQRLGPESKGGYIDEFLVKMYQGGISDSYMALKEGFLSRKRNHCVPLIENVFKHLILTMRFYGGRIKRKLNGKWNFLKHNE